MWGKSVRIARIYGVDIKVDASWFLIAALVVWSLATAFAPSDVPAELSVEVFEVRIPTLIASAVVAMIGLMGSLIVHELAHAVVARHCGHRITGITLFLFGGVADLQSEPRSGAAEFWIAVAGPLGSLGLALGVWLVARIAGTADLYAPALPILGYLALLNLALALVNILPAFPLDGGQILRAWLWSRSGDLFASTARAVSVSAVIAIGLMGLGLLVTLSGAIAAGPWLILTGLFLLVTSRSALAGLEARVAFDGRSVATLMTAEPWTATIDQSLSDLVTQVFLKHAVTFAPVMEHDSLLGYVDTRILRKIDNENWATTTVEDVLENLGDDNSVPLDMPGPDLLERIMVSGRSKFLVVDDHRLVGVVTLSDVLAVLNVSRELGYVSDRSYSLVARK